MSREPRDLVFPDSPADARVSPSSPATTTGAPTDSGPRALVFNDPPAGTTPPIASRNSTSSPGDSGPQPLVFPDTPSKPKPAVVADTSAPKALSFPKAPAKTPSTPKVASASASVKGAGAAQPGEPAALIFPSTPAKPRVRTPGELPFASKVHGTQANVMAKALSLSRDVAEANIARLDRMVASLLPLRQEALEDYGSKMLTQCREHAMRTARISARHVLLGGADLLAAALASTAPAVGLRQKLALKFQQATGSETPTTWVVRLNALRRELVEVLKEVRTARPEARTDAERMALLLLALRSTAEVCGTPPDRVLAFALEQRLETLRVALTQATLAPAQLDAIETTAALQMVEVDRLINVTFSAVALANGMRSAT